MIFRTFTEKCSFCDSFTYCAIMALEKDVHVTGHDHSWVDVAAYEDPIT